MTPVVSAIMSVYNGARFLRQAIESILTQSFKDFEFLIIDDGSTDATPIILQEYAACDSRVRIVTQVNMGLTYSLNRGVGLARASLLARMDADDVAVKHRFLWQVHYLREHPTVDLLGGAYDLIDIDGKTVCSTRLPLDDEAIREALLDSTALLHPSVMMRKSAFEAVGGYREVKYAEDYDLWLRLSEHGNIANLPQVLLQYRVHPDQISVSKCREQALWTGATQAAGGMRRRGKQDPLEGLHAISSTVLESMGVSPRSQHSALARAYLRYMRNMSRIGEYGLALQALSVVSSAECALADRWILADAFLWAGKIQMKKGHAFEGAMNLSRAVRVRPMILGRPFKRLATWVPRFFLDRETHQNGKSRQGNSTASSTNAASI